MSGLVLKRFNEGSSGNVTATFKNAADIDQAPVSARYRIDCETNIKAVRDWEVIASPVAVQAVPITSDDTLIINDANEEEIRLITVEGTYGAGDNVTEQIRIAVDNLPFYKPA